MAKKYYTYYHPDSNGRSDYRQYDPKSMFEIPSEEQREAFALPEIGLTGGVNLDLAETFARQRFDTPRQKGLLLGGPWEAKTNNSTHTTNSGAAQLFDRATDRPVSRAFGNTSHQVFDRATDRPVSRAFGNTSHQAPPEHTTWGHSERQNMLNVLDDYMKQEGNSTEELKHPSYYAISPNPHDKEREILQALVQNAPAYKNYLEGANPKKQQIIVKEWSQRKRCNNHTAPGGSCEVFTDSIYPEGSLYGYIYPDGYDQRIFNEWKLAYEKYYQEKMRPKSTPFRATFSPSGRDDAPPPSKRQNTVPAAAPRPLPAAPRPPLMGGVPHNPFYDVKRQNTVPAAPRPPLRMVRMGGVPRNPFYDVNSEDDE